MSKLELTLLKNPTLQDVYRLAERLTRRPCGEADKREAEHLVATRAKGMIKPE
jgi:hypothetical protein